VSLESSTAESVKPESQSAEVKLAEVQPTEVQPTEVQLAETIEADLPAQRVVATEHSMVDAFQQLDPGWIRVEQRGWWILTAIGTAILLAVWLVVGFVVRENFDAIQWSLLLIVASVAFVGFLSSRYFPRRAFESTLWQLRANGLEIRNGIWWRHRIFIPREQIQHTDVQQGPVMRMFGLATLVVNTGGTHEPSIPLSGLSLATAESIRDQLTNPNQQANNMGRP
jgi:uncharacterized protein